MLQSWVAVWRRHRACFLVCALQSAWGVTTRRPGYQTICRCWIYMGGVLGVLRAPINMSEVAHGTWLTLMLRRDRVQGQRTFFVKSLCLQFRTNRVTLSYSTILPALEALGSVERQFKRAECPVRKAGSPCPLQRKPSSNATKLHIEVAGHPSYRCQNTRDLITLSNKGFGAFGGGEDCAREAASVVQVTKVQECTDRAGLPAVDGLAGS